MQECYIIMSVENLKAAIEPTNINICSHPRHEFRYFVRKYKILSVIKIYILLAFKSRIYLRDSNVTNIIYMQEYYIKIVINVNLIWKSKHAEEKRHIWCCHTLYYFKFVFISLKFVHVD